MTEDEIVDLLTCAAAFDRRTVGEGDVDAWRIALGDLGYEDARLAIVQHYAESADWLMPAHVRDRVRVIRRHRVQDTLMPAPPPELTDDPAAYLAWLRRTERAIADGYVIRPALPPRRPRALEAPRRLELEAGE